METKHARRASMPNGSLKQKIYAGIICLCLMSSLLSCATLAPAANLVTSPTVTSQPSAISTPIPDWENRCDPSPTVADTNYVMPLRILFTRWNSMVPFTPMPDNTFYRGLVLIGADGKAIPKVVDEWDAGGDAVVSPDRSHLAYVAFLEKDGVYNHALHVIDTQGENLQVIPNWDDKPFSVLSWLSDSRLLLSTESRDVILDLESMKQELLPVALPSRYRASFYFNPNGEYAVIHNGEGGKYTIYNVRSGEKALMSNIRSSDRQPFVTWSPDGLHFVIFGENVATNGMRKSGLFIFDLAGQYQQVNSYYGEQPYWSPDGRFIAFRYGTPSDIPDFTVLYDMVNKKEIRFCDGFSFLADNVVWSPDGRYLITRAPLKIGFDLNWAIIDIATGETVIIPDTMHTKILSIANEP